MTNEISRLSNANSILGNIIKDLAQLNFDNRNINIPIQKAAEKLNEARHLITSELFRMVNIPKE